MDVFTETPVESSPSKSREIGESDPLLLITHNQASSPAAKIIDPFTDPVEKFAQDVLQAETYGKQDMNEFFIEKEKSPVTKLFDPLHENDDLIFKTEEELIKKDDLQEKDLIHKKDNSFHNKEDPWEIDQLLQKDESHSKQDELLVDTEVSTEKNPLKTDDSFLKKEELFHKPEDTFPKKDDSPKVEDSLLSNVEPLPKKDELLNKREELPELDIFRPQQPAEYFHSDSLINAEKSTSAIPEKVEEEVEEVSDGDEAPPPEPVPRDYPEIGAVEPTKLLSACGLDTWFKPQLLHPQVEALIYWRDPKKSGIVFGSVLIVLLSLTLYSLISVVAYTSLTILIAAISFRIYKSVLQAVQKTQDGHPFSSYLVPILEHPVVSGFFRNIEEYLDIDVTVSSDRAKDLAGIAVDQLNSAVSELRRRFLVEDIVDSLKFGLALWLLTYLGAWFNGLTLIILAFVALFTLPKVYENNQQQIDANLEIVREKINAITEKVQAVIPIGKKTESEAKSKDE